MMQGNMITRPRSRNVKPRRNRIAEKKDVISTLPDHVLANILSCLTVKEAARTSMLSTQWRTEWTNFSGVLDFDHSLQSFALRKRKDGLVKCRAFVCEWEKFMATIDHVMKTLKSSSIQGLRICMDLGNPEKITEWFKFAEEKKLHMLDLNFQYNFAYPFYETSVRIRNKMLTNSFRLESLRVLRLANVDVSGEVIEGFLASSPHLETLCIRESRMLKKLKVSGEELKLKHLELVDCIRLSSLSISAENLLTFRFIGDCEIIKFESVPSLVEASFGGWFCNFMQLNMKKIEFHKLLSQVHVLKLKLRGYFLDALEDLPVFHNVKQLEMQIPHDFGLELERAVTLLGVFPSISVLKIKFQRTNFRLEIEEEWKGYMENKLLNLTEMEISGYKRDTSEIELLVTIFKNAPNLKRVVVDPLPPWYMDRTEGVKALVRETNRTTTEWYVEALKPSLPSSVDLIVI